MRSTKVLLAVAVICLGLWSNAATAPQLIDYQGFLKTTGGTPVTSTLSMTFTIYTAVTGGTSKWSETQGSVSVTGGLFNVTLGSSTAIPDTVFNGDDRYLEISIGGTALSPRTRIVSSAYGQRVETIDGATGGVLTGSVTAGKGSFGTSNSNSGTDAFAAGSGNSASGDMSTIGGGNNNIANGDSSVVAGGAANSATASGTVVSGGVDNHATAGYSFVGGGLNNDASSEFSVVCGGGGLSDPNVASGDWSFVGGGRNNKALNRYSVVTGGKNNTAEVSDGATVGGGVSNHAYGIAATVAGGALDTVHSNYGVVGGGYHNIATGFGSLVPGGYENSATAYVALAAGDSCIASGSRAFALGHRANATHAGSFVWSDQSGNSFSSSANNEVSIRSAGGVRIYTNSGLTAGVTLAAGGSQWVAVSDSTKKRNIRLVDTREVLQKVMQLPVSQWSYKSQDASIEHVGPMAQDFYRLFGIGENDRTISMLDPAGIALAAIQELYKMQMQFEAKTSELSAMQQELADLKAMVQELAAEVHPTGDQRVLGSTITEKPLAMKNEGK